MSRGSRGSTTEERVEVKVVDCRKGKGLFAKCTIHKGETILEEKPLVCAQFAWNELYKYRACEFCLRSLETAEEMSRRLTNNPSVELPHPECCTVTPKEFVSCPQCQVEYCSAACQQKAWQAYHQTLCMGPSRQDPTHPLNKLLEIWRNMHYPPETATIMLLVKMIAMVKQATDKDGVVAAFSQFVNATVNEEEQMAHKLLGKQFVENLALLRQGLMEAVFTEEVQQWFTPEGFQSLMALIGTNSQGIGTSSVSVWAKNCELLELPEEERQTLDSFIDQLYLDLEKVTGIQFLNCEGSGLYQMQSACNHSCQPNAEITFPYNDHTLVLVALEDIMPEEEICISYLDECTLERSRHSRQAFLRENYLFTCDCKKCLEQADDPDVTSEEEMDEEDEDEEDVEDGDMDEEEEALEALKD